MTGLPLHGKSVVVTRPADQADALCGLLSARGALPVRFPTILVRPADDAAPLDRAIRRLAEYHWVVFTSANSARFFSDRVGDAPESGWPPALRVAAVGEATAARLAASGIPVTTVPETSLGSAIAGALGPLAGRRILLPRADIGREETIEALEAAGAVVDPITLYHTVPASPDPGGMAALRAGVDAVTFTSPSTVRNFGVLLGDARAAALLAGRVVVTIGPTTSRAVRDAGWASPVEASRPTTEALVMALEEHFAQVPRHRDPS